MAAWASAANAVVTEFFDEGAWEAAYPGFLFEGFDDVPQETDLGAQSFTFASGLQVISNAANLRTTNVGYGDSAGGSAPNVLTDLTQGIDSDFVFVLPQEAAAAGLLLIDHENGDNPEWIGFFHGTELIHRLEPLPFDNTGGGLPTADTPALFVGIATTDQTITHMLVHFDAPAFFQDSVAVDNVHWTPEPAVGSLFAVGTLAAMRRRRR